jgi:phosphoribosylformimino-5-aminoimidazole carboxamide ribotide isomerase
MRLIPVLDLKGGVAVHAVRGERARYAPVQSVLAPTADPAELARAFMTKLGCRECYVADLDAIQGHGDHGLVIRAIADLGLAVWLDAGVSTPVEAARALDRGAARVIIGTETLRDPDALPSMVGAAATQAPGQMPVREAVDPDARAPVCILSLDLREGRLLGGSPAVERLDPVDLASLAWAAGIRSFIVLDLARVGSGDGVQTAVAMTLRAAVPGAEIIVGGGVRGAADVRELARAGFDGVLVATALHTGAITATAISDE